MESKGQKRSNSGDWTAVIVEAFVVVFMYRMPKRLISR